MRPDAWAFFRDPAQAFPNTWSFRRGPYHLRCEAIWRVHVAPDVQAVEHEARTSEFRRSPKRRPKPLNIVGPNLARALSVVPTAVCKQGHV